MQDLSASYVFFCCGAVASCVFKSLRMGSAYLRSSHSLFTAFSLASWEWRFSQVPHLAKTRRQEATSSKVPYFWKVRCAHTVHTLCTAGLMSFKVKFANHLVFRKPKMEYLEHKPGSALHLFCQFVCLVTSFSFPSTKMALR